MLKASLHMVDGEGVCSEESLNTFISDAGLYRSGTDYNVVSILGCQSSGKSTLLNMLFGTAFEVMDADAGRSQTTKGVWVARANTEDVANIVMDVEGTDSKERGEDNQSFERKTSLLSLALAEVLVVNIWEHDIGRYNASNYALLKTVMEVNLQLFARKDAPKTYMLFVVRDHAQTPIERLETMVNKDIGEIWKSLSKPEAFADSQVSDFFDMGFCPLPHFVHQPDKFKESVQDLRSWFNDPNHAKFLFKPEYSKSVPADGFPHYAAEIWSTIQENKDLDLPTQREMVGMYRCDEIMNDIYAVFSDSLKDVKARDNDALGSQLQTLFDASLAEYNELAMHYSENVQTKKRDELLQKMRDASHTVFESYLIHARQSAFLRFKEGLIVGLSTDDGKASRDFAKLVEGLTSEALTSLPTAAANAVPGDHCALVDTVDSDLDADQWSYGGALQELRNSCRTEAAHLRTQQLSLFDKEVDSKLSDFLKDTQEVFDLGKTSMWKDMEKAYSSIDAKAKAFVTEGLAGFAPSDDEEAEAVSATRRKMRELVKDQAEKAASNLQVKMRKKFDAVFRFDKAGVPRAWLPSDNIRDFFLDAVRAASEVLELYATNKLSAFGGDAAILSESEQEEVMRLFKADVESAFVEAQRMQEYQKNRTSIPWFFWLMLVFFGFNEVTTVLFSPIYLIMTIAILGGALYGYILMTSSSSPTLAMVMPVLHQLGIGPYIEPVVNMALDALGMQQETAGDASNDTDTPAASSGSKSKAGASSSTAAGSSSSSTSSADKKSTIRKRKDD